MAEALSPMQLESVVPGFRISGILVDNSVGRVRFGWEAGRCRTLVVNSRRACWVVGRVTIIRTAGNESQNGRWVSFLELNDVDCPSADITGRYGRAGHYGNDTILIGRRSRGGPIGDRKLDLEFRQTCGFHRGHRRVGVVDRGEDVQRRLAARRIEEQRAKVRD